ncbi:MAG: hypothetical protein HYW50_04355 [Candidatus Diapherotrites archaeon]|nr:hypothetical protein [Candidatus Diapherotrites archaeon]
MKHVVIAPFEDNARTVLSGIKEFPTEKVVLLVPSHSMAKAREALKEFELVKVPVELVELDSETDFEEVFGKIAHIKAKEKEKDLLLNLNSTHGLLSCILLSAAFVNGIKAFEIMNEKLMVFPVLKFSYYDILSDKKLLILKSLGEHDCCDSLEDISRRLKLGPSVVNYHVYGNDKNPGLKELGIVEIERQKGKVILKVTTLGKLLLKDKLFQNRLGETAEKKR